MSAIPNKAIEAEIVDDKFKAPILQDIKYPIKINDIDALLSEYKNIPDIDLSGDVEIIAEQFKFVETGHKKFVKARNQIEKTRKILKSPALDYGKKVDAIAKEFQSMIIGTETALKVQRTKVEENEARKQREAEEAEEKRVENIKISIKYYRDLPMQHINSSSYTLNETMKSLMAPTVETFEEFQDEALEAFTSTQLQLKQMFDNKLLVENAQKLQEEAESKAKKEEAERQALRVAEQKKLDDERAEFERQKAEFEAQQRAIQEEKDREEAERDADELMKRQEAERVEKRKQDKINLEEAKSITHNKIIDYDGEDEFMYDDFIEAVINDEIPNIKWVQDAN